MKLGSPRGIIVLCALIISMIMLSSGFFLSNIALADEGVAMSGTFAGQKYVIPSGSSASSSEIFVTVISEYETNIGIQMTCLTPVGVNINLSDTDFTLDPGESQPISIEVQTTEDAVSGNLSITATPYIVNPGGVQTLPEITHTASLTIIGESASVTLLAVSPDDTPVIAELRLFKLIEGRYQEVAYDTSASSLNAIVAPGTFLAQAYVGGQMLDEETFDIAADENKTIKLTAGTIYFENPGLLPYYDNDGKLGYINIYYTVRNVYEPVDNVAIKLLVKLDGNTIEQKPDLTIPILGEGRTIGSIDYFPYSGNGLYSFTLQMFVDGVLYTCSPEMPFEVDEDGGSSGTGDDSNLPLIVGIVCAVVLLLDIAIYMIYRSRKAKHTKS